MLTQEAADLREVDEGPFGSGNSHQGQAVVRERLALASWQAGLHINSHHVTSYQHCAHITNFEGHLAPLYT